MEDQEILQLYRSRSEDAVSQTKRKYGAYCMKIAKNILVRREDCDECLNDTLLQAWNRIPPDSPDCFQAYLAKITRNLALSRYRSIHAAKRGGSQVDLALEELEETLPSVGNTDAILQKMLLSQVLNRFLGQLRPDARRYFIQRYWYLYSVKDIAGFSRVTESKVKMSLMRSRRTLKMLLEKEGIDL